MTARQGRLAIVGAGSVGSSAAYAALIRGSAGHVALYDIAEAKVEAEVLDLAHGAQFTAGRITGGADIGVVADADVVVITAGAKQQPGQSRMALAEVNAGIIAELMPRLLELAPEAIHVIVSNPCDVLVTLAQRASGLPPERVLASGTVLDTSRLRRLLAERAGVATSSVHAHIVGEHGDTEFPLWSNAAIGPVPILEWTSAQRGRFTEDELGRIAVEVRDAAYRVIRGKGATNYAIGLCVARIVEAILGDERAILPVSTVLSDFHGIDGVALSVPSVVGAAGAAPIRETPFADEELERLRASADAIRAAAEALVTPR